MRTFLKVTFLLSLFVTCVSVVALAVIFQRSYADPRWRMFDFNSQQATEGEIYNVAEIPCIQSVELTASRTLRFTFTPPIETSAWTVQRKEDPSSAVQVSQAEIAFPDQPLTATYQLIPDGVDLLRDIEVTIAFYPTENYAAAGLSWPDNYFTPWASIPFSLQRPHSVDEWAGLPDDDPDMRAARDILGDRVDRGAAILDRSAQVFRFVMDQTKDAGGTPTDAVQDACPLDTYRMLTSGEGKGWCENKALVYYLFANAAGVKTRLVDLAGKFGPLKLTGHYFCESWDPATQRWFLVDPTSSAARVIGHDGRLLNALEIKKLFDLDLLDGCSVLSYDSGSDGLVVKDSKAYVDSNRDYFAGDVVIAYQFSYPKNKTYSRLHHFLFYPTLLYAPFALPDYFFYKTLCLWGAAAGLAGAFLAGTRFAFVRARARTHE